MSFHRRESVSYLLPNVCGFDYVREQSQIIATASVVKLRSLVIDERSRGNQLINVTPPYVTLKMFGRKV
jgi:hypothetical protein